MAIVAELPYDSITDVIYPDIGPRLDSVAKTSDGLIQQDDNLTPEPPETFHEDPVPVQMASFPTRNHLMWGSLVSALFTELPGRRRTHARSGMSVDYTTVFRWVQRYAPELFGLAA